MVMGFAMLWVPFENERQKMPARLLLTNPGNPPFTNR